MIVLGLRYIFSSLACVCVHICAHASGTGNGILRLSGYWLSWNDGDDGGEGRSWPTYILLFLPHTPTHAWLPNTHHSEGMMPSFAYSYPSYPWFYFEPPTLSCPTSSLSLSLSDCS